MRSRNVQVNEADIAASIASLLVPTQIAEDLVRLSGKVVAELRMRDLERPSAGKFVETVVQMLQSLDPTVTAYSESVHDVDRQLRDV